MTNGRDRSDITFVRLIEVGLLSAEKRPPNPGGDGNCLKMAKAVK